MSLIGPGLDADLPVSAAWLHDIGYAPEFQDAGSHPVDGARHLRRLGVDERVVFFVAHRSFASMEADVSGQAVSSEFPVWDPVYDDALC